MHYRKFLNAPKAERQLYDTVQVGTVTVGTVEKILTSFYSNPDIGLVSVQNLHTSVHSLFTTLYIYSTVYTANLVWKKFLQLYINCQFFPCICSNLGDKSDNLETILWKLNESGLKIVSDKRAK